VKKFALKISRRAVPKSAAVLIFALFLTVGSMSNATPEKRGVQIFRNGEQLRVEINGKLFTEYYYTNVPQPFCYPLIGPRDVEMTRNFPMKIMPKEEHDHPHHRSLWFAHGSVSGHDFWREINGKTGRIVHKTFDEIKSGKDLGVIKTRNDWVAADGKLICTDERLLRFYAPNGNQVLFDFEITLQASHGPLLLGGTKEGMMAIRVAETMRLKANKDNVGKPTGHIVTSDGLRDAETWGKRAKWCDYHGSVNGEIVGIAIFDHPKNPRHPTWWMVRDYGLFAANPFGQHEFENSDDKTSGDMKIPLGGTVTFRYRFYLHEGNEKQAEVAAHYRDYVKTTSATSK
jgi:hypothetical protein